MVIVLKLPALSAEARELERETTVDCVLYGVRKSSRLYLKVCQASWSHKGKQCHSRVSVSFPASRASLTFKRLQSSQHSETCESNAPLITLLLGSFVMDTSSQPNLPPFRCVPSASGFVGIHYLCSSVLKIKTWHLGPKQPPLLFQMPKFLGKMVILNLEIAQQQQHCSLKAA